MANYDLNMNNQRIYNCLDPAAAQDVATRNYVDERAVAYTAEGQIQYAGPSPFLPTTLSVGASGDVLTLAGSPALPTWALPTASSGVKYAIVQLVNAETLCYNSNSNMGGTTNGSFSIFYQQTNDNITFTISNGELVYTGTGSVQVSFVFSSLLNTVQVSGMTLIDFINDSQWFPYFNANLQVNIYTRDPTQAGIIYAGNAVAGNNSSGNACQYNFCVQASAVLAAGGRTTLGINYSTNYIFNSNFQSPGLVAFDVSPVSQMIYITAIRLT